MLRLLFRAGTERFPRGTNARLSFDGATISRVQLNLTNFHERGLIGFINYACTTRTRAALPKTRHQPCCSARSCVDVSRGCAPWPRNGLAPSYSLFSRFVPCTAFRGIERNDRSDRLPSLSRATLPSGNRLPSTTVHRIRCTAMRAYIQDLLIKFCALRYPPLFVGFLHLAEIYWPITARGKFLTVSTPIAGCNVIVCLAS